jgi:hypothetical protein
MRAVVSTRYGPPEVLRLQDLPTPTPPEERGAHPHSGDFCDVERLLPPRAEADSRLPDHGAADIGVGCAQTTGTGLGAVRGSGCGRIGRPASGAVGTSAVQLARHIGAQVTGVCRISGPDRIVDVSTVPRTSRVPRRRAVAAARRARSRRPGVPRPRRMVVSVHCGVNRAVRGRRLQHAKPAAVDEAPPIETTRRRPVTSPPCRRRVAGCVTR